jgi:hypothetical protein
MPGRFYFAWIDDDETTFDPTVHNREDEDIFSFTVEHNEGDFATLTLEIRNPRIGLLSPGRKTHAWLSYAPQDAGPAELRPLLHGRLIGIPNNINAEIVTLMFTARPDDFVAQKGAVAASLRVLPFYDEVFIAEDKRGDPDVVFEARTELWHIDRVTGLVLTSDLLVAEDGEVEFSADDCSTTASRWCWVSRRYAACRSTASFIGPSRGRASSRSTAGKQAVANVLSRGWGRRRPSE